MNSDSTIRELSSKIAKAFVILVKFLIVVFLGVVWIVLKALPWIIRIACVGLWILGIGLTYIGASELYRDYVSILAVSVSIIIVLVSTPLFVLRKKELRKNIWGTLLLLGLLGAAVWFCSDLLRGSLIVGVFPTVAFVTLSLYSIVRFKHLQEDRNARQQQFAD